MTYDEAIKLLDNAGDRWTIVRCGKNEYYLYRDVLETFRGNDGDRTLIYGDYVNPHPRVKCSYKWFYIENATFSRYEDKEAT